MPTNRGAAVIFGCGITATAGGIIWDGEEGLNQSEDFSREADIAEVRDAFGNVALRVYHNGRKTLSISVVPADNSTDDTFTAASGVVNADLFLVAPGTIVTIIDANSTITDGTHAAKYLLDSCRRRTTNTGQAVAELTLTQYDDNDVAIAVS